jgi:hypothetical protein
MHLNNRIFDHQENKHMIAFKRMQIKGQTELIDGNDFASTKISRRFEGNQSARN